MSIFKRGKVYWYHFLFNGEHIQEEHEAGEPPHGPPDRSGTPYRTGKGRSGNRRAEGRADVRRRGKAVYRPCGSPP